MTGLNKLSDQELFVALKGGDPEAYTEIYHRYSASIYIHVYNKLQSREESRDIVQDLFRSLWERRKDLNIQTALAGYLFAAARYRVFELISHRNVVSRFRDSISDFAAHGECITDHLVREKQLLTIIDEAIAALPEKMQEIFVLSRKQHLTHKEIAAKLGISEKTVKNQVNNSLKILRAKLGSALFFAFLL